MNADKQLRKHRQHRGRARVHVKLGRPAIAALGSVVFLAPLFAAAPALAQEERSVAPSLPDSGGEEPAASPDRVQTLEERLNELNERLRESEDMRQKSVSLLSWNGYVDFGFFIPLGNGGVGWVRDTGSCASSPSIRTTRGPSWATSCRPRSTRAARSPTWATRPGARAAVRQHQLRRRRGLHRERDQPSSGFQLSDRAILRTSVNFVPRTGSDFALGDFVDADLGELEYLLTPDGKTSLFVGKTLPVFGIEYKDRKSDQRFGITPSLIARYTTGSQLGIKVRSKLLDDWLILAASVTNNSSTIEKFHFYSEIDKNNDKFLNGRVAVSIPVGHLYRSDDRLEIGVSGEYGAQDRATDTSGKTWLAGVDVQYLGVNFAVKGQLMEGRSPGRPDPVDNVYGLHLNPSGYLELDWQLLPLFGIYARAEFRDALVTLGTDRIYVTKEWRATGGVRVVVNPHMVVKGEYLHNDEYGGINEFDNDIVTSSMVLFF